AVAGLFYLAVAALTRLNVAQRRRPGRGTIVVFNHTSDLDVPVAVVAVAPPGRVLAWIGRTTFVGRSDLFLPGFLALRFPELGPLRRFLFPLGLRPILRTLRVVEVGKSGPRLAAEWLEDLRRIHGGGARADTLLSPAWSERFRALGAPPDA